MTVVGAFLINSVSAFYLEDFYSQIAQVFLDEELCRDLTTKVDGEEDGACLLYTSSRRTIWRAGKRDITSSASPLICLEADMHNELTKMDLKKMQEELDYRRITLRPQLLEEVKVARSFGDLSENFEYKAAKRDKNKNESRIRFLENMIKTAVVIEDHSGSDTVGLYDKVTVYLEEDGEEETWQVVTTVRQDVYKRQVYCCTIRRKGEKYG